MGGKVGRQVRQFGGEIGDDDFAAGQDVDLGFGRQGGKGIAAVFWLYSGRLYICRLKTGRLDSACVRSPRLSGSVRC